LIGPFSNYLVPNFDYLFTVGLYFSLLATNFQPQLVDKVVSLVSKSDDPLKEDILNILKNYILPFDRSKFFEFVGNNFVSQAAWVADPSLLPDQKILINLFMKSKILLFIANEKNYVDAFFIKEVESFLREFSKQFSNFPYLNGFINEFLDNSYLKSNISDVRKVLEYISNSLGTINEFIKPYQINSKQEVDKILETLVYLNLAQKDSNQFNLAYRMLDDKKLVDELMIYSSKFSVDRNKAVTEICKNLYSTYVGILSSHFKKSIKSGDLSYGDGFYFLKLYSLSSMLSNDASNNTNYMDFNYLKISLKNELIFKKFGGNGFTYLLDNMDKNIMNSAIDVIKRLGNKVSPWVIQKSPDMPKDKTFWLRLNLWVKIYNSLDKQDKNYQIYKNFMINKLRSIVQSYPDTSKFYNFVNGFLSTESYLDNFVKNLENLLRTIAGFPIANSYDNPDYLFSQIVRLSFLKDNNNNSTYKSTVSNEFINKIMTKDNILNKLVIDLGDYNINLKGYSDKLDSLFYQVVDNFYQASSYYF